MKRINTVPALRNLQPRKEVRVGSEVTTQIITQMYVKEQDQFYKKKPSPDLGGQGDFLEK